MSVELFSEQKTELLSHIFVTLSAVPGRKYLVQHYRKLEYGSIYVTSWQHTISCLLNWSVLYIHCEYYEASPL